ncbi:MAG: nucleotidyltransferase domain-containing protein [Deltaproteobacteria bacterium]|nr:nucleotidyltransferase domain-containing protein [Deltaproteobacteria bacterium]MCB9789301.1 nucleotidyltransferase domain-containing protein [Deltaproteobacteria bacterium]
MSVTAEEAAAHLRQRAEATRARALSRAAALRERLPAARALLVDGYGARRVVLFGSLATGEVHEGSDVDLAVEGLPKLAYFDALAALMDAMETRVDLVRLEDAPPSLAARIEAEGEPL